MTDLNKQRETQEPVDEAPVRRTPVEARQGGRSRLNLRVLILSLGITFVILAALYLLFFPVW